MQLCNHKLFGCAHLHEKAEHSPLIFLFKGCLWGFRIGWHLLSLCLVSPLSGPDSEQSLSIIQCRFSPHYFFPSRKIIFWSLFPRAENDHVFLCRTPSLSKKQEVVGMAYRGWYRERLLILPVYPTSLGLPLLDPWWGEARADSHRSRNMQNPASLGLDVWLSACPGIGTPVPCPFLITSMCSPCAALQRPLCWNHLCCWDPHVFPPTPPLFYCRSPFCSCQ